MEDDVREVHKQGLKTFELKNEMVGGKMQTRDGFEHKKWENPGRETRKVKRQPVGVNMRGETARKQAGAS